MNLYSAKLNRINLRRGMMEMSVIVHASNPQSAGKQIKKNWPAWVMIGKLEPIRKPIAINMGVVIK